jgi:Cellulose binding domain
VLSAGGQEAFTAAAYDQFGNLISPGPAVSWSVVQGVGTIDAMSGLYTAPQAGGTATIQASSGGIGGTADITISSPPIVITPPPAQFAATVAFSVASAGRKEFQAGMTITNTGTTAIVDWTLQFRFAARIREIWDARIRRHRGQTYVIENAGGDGTIAPGQSVSFGFRGRSSGLPSAPTSYLLNGIAIPGSGVTSDVTRVHGRQSRTVAAERRVAPAGRTSLSFGHRPTVRPRESGTVELM